MLRLLLSNTKGGKDFKKPDLNPVILVFIDSSCRLLSDGVPNYARVSVIFLGFLHYLVLANLVTSIIKVNLPYHFESTKLSKACNNYR